MELFTIYLYFVGGAMLNYFTPTVSLQPDVLILARAACDGLVFHPGAEAILLLSSFMLFMKTGYNV